MDAGILIPAQLVLNYTKYSRIEDRTASQIRKISDQKKVYGVTEKIFLVQRPSESLF